MDSCLHHIRLVGPNPSNGVPSSAEHTSPVIAPGSLLSGTLQTPIRRITHITHCAPPIVFLPEIIQGSVGKGEGDQQAGVFQGLQGTST